MDKESFIGGDTRRAKRLKFEVPAYFSVDKSMGKNVRLTRDTNVIKGITQNINSRGVAVITHMFLPFGTVLDLEIRLDKSEDKKFASPMNVLGKIVAIKAIGGGKYRMSIAFVKIEDKNRNALDDYLKEKLIDKP